MTKDEYFTNLLNPVASTPLHTGSAFGEETTITVNEIFQAVKTLKARNKLLKLNRLKFHKLNN